MFRLFLSLLALSICLSTTACNKSDKTDSASKTETKKIDPMLATGHTAVHAIRLVKETKPRSIKFMCLLAAPEGVETLHKSHPDVTVYTAAVDSHLNEKAYIVPGLGDAGDRIYGTK